MVKRRAALFAVALAALACSAARAAPPPDFDKAYVTFDFVTASPKFDKAKHTREVRIGEAAIGAVPYRYCHRWNYYWERFQRIEIPDRSLVRDGMTVSFHNLYGYVANVHIELTKAGGPSAYSTVDATRYTDIRKRTWAYAWYPFDTEYVDPKQPIVTQPLRFGVPAPQAPPGKGLTHALRVVKLKQHYPDTVLIRNGAAAAVLVAADTLEGLALAEFVAARIKDGYGVALPVRTRKTLSLADLKRCSAVFLGPPLAGPYQYYVRTYHDWYGFGTNEVYVGGDAAGGLGQGVRIFLDRLKEREGEVHLPRTFVLKPNDYWVRSGEEAGDMARFARAKATADRASGALISAERLLKDKTQLRRGQDYLGLFAGINVWVERYYISGHRDFMEAAVRGYLLIAEMFEREQDRRERYFHWHDDVHAERGKMMANWDLVEEEESLTDEQRLAVTNALLRCMADRVTVGASYQFPMSGDHGTRWSFQNHESGGLVATASAYGYFRKYYPTLEWVNEWRAEADVAMAKQARCFSTNENSNGYQFYGLAHVRFYSDYTDDRHWYHSGNLYRLATEHLMKHDNLGLFTAQLGVAGGVDPRPGYMWLAADLLGEPKFRYMAPRIKLAKALTPTQPLRSKGVYYCRTTDWRQAGVSEDGGRDRAPPLDHLGVKPLFLDRGLYWEVLHSHYGFPKAEHGGRSIPRAKALDKLCFRNGFHPDDDYLLIDGWGGRAAHAWNSGNAIVSYTKNRRCWLARGPGRVKEEKRVEVHNTVTVKFNGADNPPSPFTGLEYLADLDAAAFAGTSKLEYNHCDWHRHTIQLKDTFFAVVDRVVAREGGAFDVSSHWHPMGFSCVDGNRVQTRQIGDARFELVNVSGHMQNVKLLDNPLSQPHYRKDASMYPFVEPGTKFTSLEERQIVELQPEGAATALNVFYSYLTRTEEQAFEARPAGETAVVLNRNDGFWYVGVGAADKGGFESESRAFAFSCTAMAGAGVRQMRVDGKTVFKASEPVGAEVTAAGKATVLADNPVTVFLHSARDNRIVVDGNKTTGRKAEGALLAVELPAGRHTIQFSGSDMRNAGVFQAVSKRLAELFAATPATVLKESEPPMSEHARKGLEQLWRWTPTASIRAVLCRNLDGDAAAETVLALADGRVVALDPAGKAQFEFATPSGMSVNCLAAGDVRGTGKTDVAAGSDDRCVYLLDADGQLLWKTEPVPDSAGALGDARQDPGRKIILLSLLDADGDGKQEVYAGTNLKTNTCGQHICLDHTGKQILSGWGVSRYRPLSFFGKLSIAGKTRLILGPRGFITEVTDKPTDEKERFELGKVHRLLDRVTPETEGLKLLRSVGRMPQDALNWVVDDLDGDGDDEVITSGRDIVVSWYDGKSTNTVARERLGRQLGMAALNWRGGERGLQSLDLDGDGQKEIVVASEFGTVEVYGLVKAENKLNKLAETDLFSEVTCLASTTVAGAPRIIVGTTLGVYVLGGRGEVLSQVRTRQPVASVSDAALARPAIVVRLADADYFQEDGREAVRLGSLTAYALR